MTSIVTSNELAMDLLRVFGISSNNVTGLSLLCEGGGIAKVVVELAIDCDTREKLLFALEQRAPMAVPNWFVALHANLARLSQDMEDAKRAISEPISPAASGIHRAMARTINS